jgi:thiamine biosynthesis lipoprotein
LALAGGWLGSATAAPAEIQPGLMASRLGAEPAPFVSLVASDAPTLVVFATVWCRVCIQELPSLSEWRTQHPGARVLYVMSGTKASRTRAHVEKVGVDPSFTVIADHRGEIADAFRVRSTPTLFLLDGLESVRGPFYRVASVPVPTKGGGSANEESKVLWRDDGTELGTSYTVTVVAAASAKARVEADLGEVRAMTRVLEARLSEWKPTSEISRINERAGSSAVSVSETMAAIIDGALSVSRATDGAFDITWRPWGVMWQEAERQDAWPDAAALVEVGSRVGYGLVELTDDEVRFAKPGVQLGLAGVAKGWIIDSVADELMRRGYGDVVVNIGGDLRVNGRDERGRVRRFAIADPFDPAAVAAELEVESTAMATSGNYFRRRTIRGRRVGHIVDPRTGLPPSFEGSVTVLTRDAAMADALATALFVMGPDAGLDFAWRTPGVEVVYATSEGLRASSRGGVHPRSMEWARSDRPALTPAPGSKSVSTRAASHSRHQ